MAEQVTFLEKLKEIYRSFLGLFVVLGVFGLVLLLYFVKVPTENATTINQVLGIVVGFAAAVIGYEFGSSRGSEDKTKMLANSTPVADSSVTISTTEKNVTDGSGNTQGS